MNDVTCRIFKIDDFKFVGIMFVHRCDRETRLEEAMNSISFANNHDDYDDDYE